MRASERERERENARHQTINVERQRERRVCVISQALGDLVELGHTRVGEGHVDAATTPPALVLGIVRGRRLLLARLVPRHIMGCGDLRSLKKKISIRDNEHTHPSVLGLAFVDMKTKNLKSLSQCPHCGHV